MYFLFVQEVEGSEVKHCSSCLHRGFWGGLQPKHKSYVVHVGKVSIEERCKNDG